MTYDPVEVSRRRTELEAYMSLACRCMTLKDALSMFDPQLPGIGDFNGELSPAKIIELSGDASGTPSSNRADNERPVFVEDFGDGSFRVY